MTPSETLREAARFIRERGWCQGKASGDGGKLCMLGALSAANGRSPFDCAADPVALAALYRALPVMGIASGSAVDYNDAPGRTAEEVIALLERAAVAE